MDKLPEGKLSKSDFSNYKGGEFYNEAGVLRSTLFGKGLYKTKSRVLWFVAPAEEITVKYSIKFGKDFIPGLGGKLPFGISTRKVGGAGTNPTSGGVSLCLMWGSNLKEDSKIKSIPNELKEGEFELKTYLYSAGSPKGYGDKAYLRDRTNQRVIYRKDEWIDVEMRMRLNTPGKKNGAIVVKTNGKLVSRQRNLNLRGDNPNQLERVSYILFRGGNTSNFEADKDCYIYTTNVQIL